MNAIDSKAITKIKQKVMANESKKGYKMEPKKIQLIQKKAEKEENGTKNKWNKQETRRQI